MLKKIKELMDFDWKQTFRFELEHHEVFGLDIGSSQVKLIQMRKNGTGYTVSAAGIVDIAAAEDSKNRGEINTIRAIRECFESARIQTKLAVCSVCGPEVAVRHFKFPPLPTQEIEGAVLLEAEQVCPFNVHDGPVDYQLISNGKDSVSGIFVAATNKLIKSKVQLAKNASLDCVMMDVNGLALLNCLSKYEKPDTDSAAIKMPEPSNPLMAKTSNEGSRTTTAILNVGGTYTTLAIMGENMPFIRDMAYASNDIVRQIAVENNISTERTWQTLLGRENTKEPSIKLGDSLEKACQKLIDDVTETLRYYTAQEKSAHVEKIFVCGDFAPVEGFVELLDSRLPAKASVWNPFDKIPCDAGKRCKDILQKNGPAMAVAAGLAMREI
jgi:type IV pilus assembly protein PilM